MAKIKQSQKQQEALAKVESTMEELRVIIDLLRKDGDIQISAGKGRGAVKLVLEEGSKPREDVIRSIERLHAKKAKDVRALAKEFDLEFSEEEETILDNKKPEAEEPEVEETEGDEPEGEGYEPMQEEDTMPAEGESAFVPN